MENNTVVTILNGNPPTLEEAQKLVGGYVEMVLLCNGDQMLVDEDGLSKMLEPNRTASLMAATVVVGPAIVLQGTAKWS